MSPRTTREPNDVELRARIRAWLRYYRSVTHGTTQRDIAEQQQKSVLPLTCYN